MKEHEVLELLTMFYDAGFPGTPELSPGIITSWADVLDDVRAEEVMAIGRWWLKNKEWFPRPAQLRLPALDMQGTMPSEDAAWAMVQSEAYRQQKPPEVVYRALQDIGGIIAIRAALRPDNVRDQFLGAYRARRSQQREAIAAANSGRTYDPVQSGVQESILGMLTGGQDVD